MYRSMKSYSLSDLPDVQIGRSRFRTHPTHSTTFSQGELVPIFVKKVIPGSTWSVDVASLVRAATMIFPVMDDAELSIEAWYEPERLVWPHYKEFVGDNSDSHWAPEVEYTRPQLKFDYEFYRPGPEPGAPWYGAAAGSLANHLYKVGYLIGDGLEVSDIPNRVYRDIWNNWYRSEAYQDPVYVPRDDTDRSYGDDVGDGTLYGADLLRVNRLADYFSLAVPQPQSGDPVPIPAADLAPVVTSSVAGVTGRRAPMTYAATNTGGIVDVPTAIYAGYYNSDLEEVVPGASTGGNVALAGDDFLNQVYPNNLFAKLEGNIGTINELRTAWQIQKLLETFAVGGRRYRSILHNVWGVTVPDATVQVPEFLGSTKCLINISQVVQTSQTTDTSPQGAVSAYSATPHHDHLFTKSFVESGILMIVAHVRVRHTYGQGVDCEWFKKRLYDDYNPKLATISMQPIFSRELCATGGAGDDTVFGYKEPWAELRTDLNTLSGDFTPSLGGDAGLMGAYTFADYLEVGEDELENGFVCNDEWLQESSDNVAQTIAVPSSPQFIANFAFSCTKVLPIPVHSMPGLVDHH